MLDYLTTETWSYLIVGLIVASCCYAWAADAVLGHVGFGVVVTMIIAAGGGFGGLLATDWAIEHHKLPYGYDTPVTYAAGPLAIVTVLLIVLCGFKRLFVR